MLNNEKNSLTHTRSGWNPERVCKINQSKPYPEKAGEKKEEEIFLYERGAVSIKKNAVICRTFFCCFVIIIFFGLSYFLSSSGITGMAPF